MPSIELTQPAQWNFIWCTNNLHESSSLFFVLEFIMQNLSFKNQKQAKNNGEKTKHGRDYFNTFSQIDFVHQKSIIFLLCGKTKTALS